MSLDALRGLTMAAMILVNNPGSAESSFSVLRHAPWHGWTPADLIFPFFLFISGVAITYSGESLDVVHGRRGALHRRLFRRAVILFAIGLFLNAFPTFDLATVRIPSVLQRIVLASTTAALLSAYGSVRTQAVVALLLLVLYHGLMKWVPVPGFGLPDLSMHGNLAAWLDNLVMPGHLYLRQERWDPEGILTTIPAVSTALAGVLTGHWLHTSKDQRVRAGCLVIAGVACILTGLAWDTLFPINKNLWSPSFVLFTAGASLVALALCYWLIEIEGWRAWSWPLVVFGKNAIILYILSSLLGTLAWLLPVGRADGHWVNLHTRMYQIALAVTGEPATASLAFALVFVVVLWLPIYALNRRRIFLRF